MLLTIIIFVVILGIIVLFHEIGHFFTAKKMGVDVEEFGFGFPPRIFGLQRLTGKKIEKISENEKVELDITDYQTTDGQEIIKEKITDKIQEVDQIVPVKKWRFIRGGQKPKNNEGLTGGTIYSINWIPIGGFVKIRGEQGDGKDDPKSFASKKIWQRATILSSGVLMNFVLAFIIFSIAFGFGSPSIIDNNISKTAIIKGEKIQIVDIVKDSPAEKAELKTGDIVISLDNKQIKDIETFSQYTNEKKDQEILLKIRRGDKEIEKKLIPRQQDESSKAVIGVWLVKTGLISYPWYQSIWMGIKSTFSVTWQILVAFYEILKNLLISHHVAADIAGPVGIAVLTGQVAKMGFIYILQFMALLSINLAIINFLPFPALDGGRVLFLIIEKIKGKAVNQKIEGVIHNIGFFLLILLVIFITFKDVSRFSENIKNFINKIF